jgi:hypothetical protein
MSGQIFISYRREDSAAWAGRLFDSLKIRPSSQIFIDVDSVGFGEDFVNKIKDTVGSCDVLIAMIGADWLTSSKPVGRRRLENPDDSVRLEIATALMRGILVIPVLVDGAQIPEAAELPDELNPLARLNALKLNHDRFHIESDLLASAIEAALEKTAHKTGLSLWDRVRMPEMTMMMSCSVTLMLFFGLLSGFFLIERRGRPQSPVYAATKDHPWVNSLGMKFLPVPGTQVLFSIWNTRVQDFETFVKDTGYDATRGMYSLGESWSEQSGATWKKPGFSQSPTDPVVGVSLDDAKEFCKWLTNRERKSGALPGSICYRLPMDKEWSAAVGLKGEVGNTPEKVVKATYILGTSHRNGETAGRRQLEPGIMPGKR